uniref:Ig-like domain-containing protein n=1 Tax=Myripristis murdjan TaxID=586833 RepID=A0A667WM29_9TELE
GSTDDISPVQDEVSGTEGQSVTLTCSYQTSSSYISLHWYRHQSDQAPQFILKEGAKGNNNKYIPNNHYGSKTKFPKEKFDAQINDTSVPLRIQKLQPSDSALYYCAVQPTVTGNTQSLYKNLTANSRSCTTLQTQSPRRHFLVLSTCFKMHSFRILSGNLSHSPAPMKQAPEEFPFTGTDISLTRLLSLYSGKEPKVTALNIFLIDVMDPKQATHPLNSP